MDVAKSIAPALAGAYGSEAFRLNEIRGTRESGAEQSPNCATSRATKLPLLSFIVVNYNYGRFLETCVVSIMEQNYPNIECIVVDNASTDVSASVMERLARRYPSLEILRNTENLGQNAACCLGLARSRGSYVAFIDADDYLLPFYAATHIRTHLTIPSAVGFTSGDMAQLVDNTIVRGNYLNRRWRQVKNSTVPANEVGFSDICDLSAALGTVFLESPEFAADIQVISRDFRDWAWAPTSANVYRRDAISLLAANPKLPELKFATDAYYNFVVNALFSSAVIEKPLAVYRIHGANYFSAREHANRADIQQGHGRRSARRFLRSRIYACRV
ncbi:MAG: glycosyltransferase family 2 protein [Beijerinckiaceae bacterium]|nr:MAG: glycosyltransferase family 2 protein [Beijerinckiaceae bacterium]